MKIQIFFVLSNMFYISKGATLRNIRTLWPDAIIPYYIEVNDFDPKQRLSVMTSIMKLAANSCLKFLPLAVQPAINERAIVIENPNRLVKCSLHTALHSNRHLKVTLANDCLYSSDFDLAIMQALRYPQYNQAKDGHSNLNKLDATYSQLCHQRDCKEQEKIYKLTRNKRDIPESPENVTKYSERTTTNENVTLSNLTEYINTTNQTYSHDTGNLVKELGIGKEIDVVIEKFNNILSKVLINVRNKFCHTTQTLRSGGRINVKKGLIMNEGSGYTVGNVLQYVLSNVSGELISMGTDYSENNDFGSQTVFPTILPRTVNFVEDGAPSYSSSGPYQTIFSTYSPRTVQPAPLPLSSGNSGSGFPGIFNLSPHVLDFLAKYKSPNMGSSQFAMPVPGKIPPHILNLLKKTPNLGADTFSSQFNTDHNIPSDLDTDPGNQGLGFSFGSIGSEMVSAFLPHAKKLIKKYGIPIARKIINSQVGSWIGNQVCKLAGCYKGQ